jgi:hypothetical protein
MTRFIAMIRNINILSSLPSCRNHPFRADLASLVIILLPAEIRLSTALSSEQISFSMWS